MSEPVVEIRGVERLRSTIRRAVAELADLKRAGEAAGAIIARESSARAPRRTGRLAGSLVASHTGGGERISSALAYAGVIHYGWHAHNIEPHKFLTGAASSSEAQWLEAYERDAQRALDRVRGV